MFVAEVKSLSQHDLCVQCVESLADCSESDHENDDIDVSPATFSRHASGDGQSRSPVLLYPVYTIEQTSSKRRANVFKIHVLIVRRLLDVC